MDGLWVGPKLLLPGPSRVSYNTSRTGGEMQICERPNCFHADFLFFLFIYLQYIVGHPS